MFAMATPALAQTAPKPTQIIVNNAPAGINIDIYLDAGKVQTAVVNQQGSTGFDLDFLSLGKPQGQIYIETCKDGVRIRVISDGTTVPDDEGCNRKPVGVAFTFTCTGKITINFKDAKGSFAGCGTVWTNKWFLTGLGIAGGGILATTAGGGDTPPPAVAQQPAAPPVANTPAAPQTPAAPPAPGPSAPQPSPTVPNPDGRWTITSCQVTDDNGNHNSTLQFCSRNQSMTISASNGGMSIVAAIIWGLATGSYNTATGEFALGTPGPLSGTPFTNVAFRVVGTIDRNGTSIRLVVTMGGSGLPGNPPITYVVVLTKA